MSEKETDDYILYYDPEDESKKVTVKKYQDWIIEENKQIEISEFVYNRLFSRYIKPFTFNNKDYRENYKNGFAIMSNCCLLIETMESFHRGWENTKRRSESAFLKYFTRVLEFKEFSKNDIPTQFYKHIRCGILHQGETTGGWKITRVVSSPILNLSSQEINANKFQDELLKSLKSYRDELKNCELDSDVWKNLKTKMKSVIKNCQKS